MVKAQMMETADDARHRQSLMLLSQVCRDAEDWPGKLNKFKL